MVADLPVAIGCRIAMTLIRYICYGCRIEMFKIQDMLPWLHNDNKISKLQNDNIFLRNNNNIFLQNDKCILQNDNIFSQNDNTF